MACNKTNVDYLLKQLAGAGTVSARPMFGEYAFYCDEKVVALFCDDTFYLKNTDAGRAAFGNAEQGPPYPGAKPHLIVPESKWDDSLWLCRLVQVTANALPKPKPKKKRPK